MSDINLIEKYLEGEMTKDELQSFEKELISNNILQKKITLNNEISLLLNDVELLNFINIIQATSKLYNVKNKKKKIIKYLYYSSVAATFIFILWFFFFPNFTYTNNEIFEMYFKIEPPLINQSMQLNSTESMNKAFLYYSNRDYQEASHSLKSIINQDSSNLMAYYYLAFSNIQLNRTEIAIQNFMHIINANNNILIESSEWNVALCYIKLDMKDEAKIILDRIVDNKNNFYHDKAKDVLDILKKTD